MKILITGMTATQLLSTRRRHTYISAPVLVHQVLSKDHEVVCREVIPGESLKEYDRVIVFTASLCKLGSTYLYGALWALASRPDAWLALDDWQIGATLGSFATVAKRIDYYLWESSLAVGRKHRDIINSVTKKAIERYVKKTAKKGFINRPLLPLFPWCDLSKLGFSHPELTWYDPSPLVKIAKKGYFSPLPMRDRRCEWLLASLANYEAWVRNKLKPSWNVAAYGPKYLYGTVSENTIIELIGRYVGYISPRYNHAGSGWWRTRFAFAVQQGAILIGSEEELEPLGAAYSYDAQEIESIKPSYRADIAKAQARTFKKMTWKPGQLREFFNQLMKEG